MAEGAGVRGKKEVTRFIEEEGPVKEAKVEKLGGGGEGTVSLWSGRAFLGSGFGMLWQGVGGSRQAGIRWLYLRANACQLFTHDDRLVQPLGKITHGASFLNRREARPRRPGTGGSVLWSDAGVRVCLLSVAQLTGYSFIHSFTIS